MSDIHRYDRHPPEFEEWSRQGRALSWSRLLAVAVVLALIVCLNLYFLSPGVQRRVDYVFLRAQTALKRLQPHDLYVPTPALLTLDAQPTAMPDEPTPTVMPCPTLTPAPTSTAVPTPTPTSLPASMQLETECHEPQRWNNCGPATLAMALCFYGWAEDQYTVAEATKPDKNDKNVSPREMVAYTRSLGDMYAVMGYATDIRVLKLLLSNGFPAIVETWFIPEPGDEMGHYRLLTGYDDASQQFTTQDSYSGANQLLSYAEMDPYWKVFNRVYVVVCEANRAQELTDLLQAALDPGTVHREALSAALAEIAADPGDRYAWFNAGTNYVALERYEEAVMAYDQARMLKLPWRMLWYQFGPFEAYLRVGRYQDVIDLANANLKVADNLEESYYYRALARRALGDEGGAREDLQKALQTNSLFREAAEALAE